jgi:hypothetical protein
VLRLVTSLSECSDENQMFDASNDLKARESLLDIPVTITSARARSSEHLEGTVFAQIGVIMPDGTDAQFNIGGNAATLPLVFQRTGRLPAAFILRRVETSNGRVAWKWGRYHA